MNKYTIEIALFFITIIVLIISDTIKKIVKNKREHELELAKLSDNTRRLELYSNFDFDKIDIKISKYIEEAGEQYRMENFEYVPSDELYLNEDMMNEMIRIMTKNVAMKITPAILMLLQLSYNINNEEDLALFLYERSKNYVFNYSLKVNDIVDD